MNSISIALLLSIFWVFATTTQSKKTEELKCPYRQTVDLTNQTRHYDGSYQYQGIIIPPEEQSIYDYQFLMGYKKNPTHQHLRGCVCNKWKSCIKLCCEKDKYFNETSYECEKLPQDFKMSWNLTIHLKNGIGKNVNIFDQFVYQVGIPCKEAKPLITDLDKWQLLANGNLSMILDKIQLDTVNYCFTPYKSKGSNKYLLIPFSCPNENKVTWTLILNNYCMALSVLFLIPTIVVYLIIKQLRGNLRGKLLICYLLSLVIAYGIISFINISHIIFDPMTCNLLGYTCYFFFMSAFLWLSVLCYDIWNNFHEIYFEFNSREHRKRFIYYSLHTWTWAGIFTSLTIWAELSPSIADIYKPGIGTEMCWLDTRKWSAAIYFYGPNLIILLFNFATFAYLTVHIYKIRQDSAKFTHREYLFQENAVVIIRLFLVMGVSWIFDIISYCSPSEDNCQIIFVISDLVNATQGIWIFSLFVLKQSVFDLLKNRFSTIKAVRIKCSTTSSPTVSTNLQTFH